MVDIVVKQEGDRDARRILDGPKHLFRIEKYIDLPILNSFDSIIFT